MGTCSSFSMDNKHSAAEQLQKLFQSPELKSPIVFIVKQWANRNNVNLIRVEDAVSRNLDFSLYPGEKIELTLKNHRRQSMNNRGSIGEDSNSIIQSKNGLHCDIRRNQQFYQINFSNEKERAELWRFTHGWTPVQQGDTFRMGVSKYKLCKFVAENDEQFESIRQTLHPQLTPRCRICLSTVDTPQNPFLSPCKCEGSIKYTHLRCLSTWLFSSNLNEDQLLFIKSNKTICELCKTDITNTPEFKRIQNLLLTNIQDIPTPFGIFQCNYKNYLVLCFKQKSDYTFGRSSKANIMLQDIHISKINSEMKFSNNRLFIRDCESLHGTLMQVRDPIRLSKANLSEQLIYHNMLFKMIYEPKLQKEQLEVGPELNQKDSTKI